MANNTSGIGDPYWYEWTVGLEKIVEMLHPECEIHSVTLQASEIAGWDDVKVVFNSGKNEFYQIKHTRDEDSITFGDIVGTSKEKSLLSYLAQCWKEIPYHEDSIFILFTNRQVGNQKSTVTTKSGPITRPPLDTFFKQLKLQFKKNSHLKDIQIDKEYKNAYQNEWLSNLSSLDEEQIFKFINQLEIKTGQPDLDLLEKNILNKISQYLGIEIGYAESVLQSLYHALRNWTTTSRGTKETVTREDVYDKLKKPYKELIGDHYLEPPLPFFKSREKEIAKIESGLKEKNNKIIFITGPPGVGKTSLISNLANKRNPSIHLRYYTFKPISPENDLLPADAGNTTKAKSLWSDLLSELRELFKGNLARYKVPIRNDFITDVTNLRSEVIRLSVEYSKRINQRIVICIDGIDHAARAEYDQNENYLQTLIPPDNIPEEIVFIISGQPPEFYNKYPDWLKQEHDKIKKVEISNLSQEDIRHLLEGESIKENDYASQIIFDHTLGNTLSVLYALETLKKVGSIEEAITLFENYRLKNGLSTYYNNIWKTSIDKIKSASPSIAIKIASIFSLTSARISAKHLQIIIPDHSTSEWELILSELSPLIVNEQNHYRVLHNDAKVFFTNIIKSSADVIYKEVAFGILELYMQEKEFVKNLHNDLILLLTKAGQKHKILDVISPKFILEAYIHKCPASEVEQQIKIALNEALNLRSNSKLHEITCCIKSFNQLENEVEGTDKAWNFLDQEKKFTNELRVIKTELWNLRIIDEVLEQALFLFRENKYNRAKNLMERWFQNLIFSELLKILPETKKLIKDEELIDALKSTFIRYGQIILYTQKSIIIFKDDNVITKNILAHITSGIIDEIIETNKLNQILSTLKILPPYYFKNDFDKILFELLKKQDWINSFLFLKKIDHESIGDNYRVFAALLSLFSKNEKLINKWFKPYEENIILLFPNTTHTSEFMQIEYTIYTLVCFIMGWKDYGKDLTEIVAIVSKQALNESDQGKSQPSKVLFRQAALIGRWFSEVFVHERKDNFVFITEAEITDTLTDILNNTHDISLPLMYAEEARKFLLSVIIYCSQMTDRKFNNIINAIFLNHYNDKIYDTFWEIIWENLHRKGYQSNCETLINNLFDKGSKFWEWPNYDKSEVIEKAISVTKKTDYNKIARNAKNKFIWHTISFSNHKDYNLYYEIIWLDEILKIAPELWQTKGIDLLDLSQKAYDIGDNRANNRVNMAVTFGAVKSGPKDAYLLYKLIQNNYHYWRSYLPETIVEYFEDFNLDPNKIKIIWLFCCGYLYWCQYDDRKTIYRLKKTILDSELTVSNKDLIQFLNETNPVYYNIDTLDKIDENEYQPHNNPINGSIEVNLEKFFTSHESNFDYELLHSILIKAVEERPPIFRDIISKVYQHLLKEQNNSYWGNNRYSKIYRTVMPFLDEDQRWEIATNIINVFYEADKFHNYYALSENLNHFCLFNSLSKLDDLIEGFDRLMQMHRNWINGFGVTQKNEISGNDFSINGLFEPRDWHEFALIILLEKLDSQSGIMVENSLGAIWQIIKHKPGLLDYINKVWKSFSVDQKEYLLILFELIPLKITTHIRALKNILAQINSEDPFTIRIQSYLIYTIIKKITEEDIPSLSLQKSEAFENKSLIKYPYETIFDIDENSTTSFSSIKNHHHLFKRKIEFLEATTGYKLRDYFDNNLSLLLSKYPIVEKPYKKINLSGDFKISSRQPDDIFNNLIEHTLADEIFENISMLEIIQAITPNDDPHVFETKYQPTKNTSIWPEEYKDIENYEKTIDTILRDGVPDEHIVISGEVRLYDSSKEYRGILNSYYVPKDKLILKYRDSSTFNARSIFLYSDEYFQTFSPEDSLFVIGGGISKFIYCNNWLVPSKVFFILSGWAMNKINPYLLEVDDKKVAWLEKYYGPINIVDSRYDRQSAMHRWICKRSAYEQLLSNLKENYEIRIKSKYSVSKLE